METDNLFNFDQHQIDVYENGPVTRRLKRRARRGRAEEIATETVHGEQIVDPTPTSRVVIYGREKDTREGRRAALVNSRRHSWHSSINRARGVACAA